ncbi:MAG: ferredoxin [Rhodobacteraceae bacterium]|nr:ferredoxin [Paracoccaceae bacterium]
MPLVVAGVLPVQSDDPVPSGAQSLVLLGPAEPGFWAAAQSAPEFADGLPDPLDRLSRRMIRPLAAALGAAAIFPFDGPPYAPFHAWALRSGQIWASPLGLLVSRAAGLFVSFRGALALPAPVEASPEPEDSPCDTCSARPCTTACPVAALRPDAGYDISACHRHLDRPEGAACLSQGCAARRACPFSQRSGRRPDQSAFHMKAFHP